jgi:hypothetical protein
MIECCIDGCGKPGTVSAPHPGASVYCPDHGVCAGCGRSVMDFRLSDGLWLCPCVIAGGHGDFSLRPLRRVVVPKPLPIDGAKTKSVKDHWQRTA